MYFHLIGIKEKNGKQYDLDVVLGGGDEGLIRKFLANWGVVVVSIDEFKEDPKSFGSIIVSVIFDNTEIYLLMNSDTLEEGGYFIMSLGLEPVRINYVNNPVSDEEMKNLIDSTLLKIRAEEQEIKRQQELLELNEQKKYEESSIKDGLKVINSNIVHIEQLLKAGKGILSGPEIKKLEDYLNEMKKIRLGTNFNKMAALVLDAHILVKNAENEIFNYYDSQKFLIDKNSSVTNIDVLREYFHSNKISEKAIFQPTGLTFSESVGHILGNYNIFFKLLGQDIIHDFNNSSFDDLFTIVMNLIEYIILTIIMVISLFRICSLLLGIGEFSIYLLPAMGWLGLLVYLFNNLEFKRPIPKIIGFAVLALIYRQGLLLLVNTFAL